jgi:hypothetical protein
MEMRKQLKLVCVIVIALYLRKRECVSMNKVAVNTAQTKHCRHDHLLLLTNIAMLRLSVTVCAAAVTQSACCFHTAAVATTATATASAGYHAVHKHATTVASAFVNAYLPLTASY